MSSSRLARSRAGLAAALLLGLAALSTATGCKPKKSSSASSPAGSASAAAAATGPCADYASKVCAKTGAESPTCNSFKEATELMAPAACKEGLKSIKVTLDKIGSQRSVCDKLVQTLCNAVGPKTKACQLVTTKTASFPPAQCKMMSEHVTEIVAQLKQMEASNQPLSAELQAEIAANAPAFGPENSKVKIVEFSDFQCPYCSRAANVVHQVKEKYGDKVRFVFREYPLPMHPNARGAAEAALAANAQGKFWEFHDLLFSNQSALDRTNLESHAKKVGLDVEKFKKDLDDKKFADQVESDMKLGGKVSVEGTPTMFVNGQRVDNPTDFAAVAAMIDAALGTTPPG